MPQTLPTIEKADTPRGTTIAPDWLILGLACLGQFMVILDVTVVTVALPSIRADLGFSQTGLQWVVNAYTLTFAGFLLLGGRAADLYGRRRMFLIGLCLFTGASLIGGLAQNQAMLVFARAAQGIGGAVLAPATLTIILTTFQEGQARSRALGIWSAVTAAGGAVGSLLGGLLTGSLSWRWIFYINIPIGLALIIVAGRFLRDSQTRSQRRDLDLWGALTITGGLVALVYAVVSTDSGSWTTTSTLVGLPLAAILIGAFLVIESRTAAPLMPLRLFRSRSIAGANLVMFLLSAAVFAMWFFLSLYMQNVLGYSPLQTGFAFLPQTLAIMVGAQISSRMVTRVGPRPLLVVGSLLSAIGLALLSQVGVSTAYFPGIAVPGVLVTFGLGLAFTPLTVAATAGVRREEAGLVSGVLNTMRQIGGSIGLAVLATIAYNRTRTLITTRSNTSLPAASTAGYSRGFVVAALLAASATAASFIVAPIQRKPAESAETTSAPVAGAEQTLASKG